MPIHFSQTRMDEVRAAHMRWWRGELDRPLVKVTINDAYTPPRDGCAPLLSQANCADLTIPPEAIIDAIDNELCRQEYMGDAFPFVNFDAFGPGVLAAFCGARLDNSSGRVWFFPIENKSMDRLHIKYDPDNVWVRRIKSIYRAGNERWGGAVVMGMPDLGGVLDVVATFCGSEQLLMELYDAPDEVQRLISETETAWRAAYSDLAAELKPQRGFSDWSGLLSATPSYIIQCDFCYMIGNDMFREFVLDTLRRDVDWLDNTIYHLDGKGELNHLNDVLSIERLNAVQWVYGDGQPAAEHWLDIYRRILDAGKRIMIVGGAESYLNVQRELHAPAYAAFWFGKANIDMAKRVLEAR